MKKEKIIKYIVLIVSILIYYYLINNQYIYNFNYLKCIIYSLLISLFIYTYGILINDKNNYKFNIKIYLIIYFITLTSLTFIIGRPNLRFYNFKFYGQYNLFFTIISQLKNGTNYSIFKNIIGNLVIFIPFSLLLMINNKKYNNVLKQTIIILPIIICIELIQAFTHIGSFDIDDIEEKSQEYFKYNKDGLIVIDYLQLISEGNKIESENRKYIGSIVRRLNMLAKKLNVPIIVLSQISHAMENRKDKHPLLCDFREIDVVNYSDVVLFLYRDDYYNPDSEKSGVAELMVAKNNDGQCGYIELAWLSKYQKFANIRYQ